MKTTNALFVWILISWAKDNVKKAVLKGNIQEFLMYVKIVLRNVNHVLLLELATVVSLVSFFWEKKQWVFVYLTVERETMLRTMVHVHHVKQTAFIVKRVKFVYNVELDSLHWKTKMAAFNVYLNVQRELSNQIFKIAFNAQANANLVFHLRRDQCVYHVCHQIFSTLKFHHVHKFVFRIFINSMKAHVLNVLKVVHNVNLLQIVHYVVLDTLCWNLTTNVFLNAGQACTHTINLITLKFVHFA